jgi:large subunit ribosomal protein L3
MADIHHPKRGSHGYWPRKRAKTETPHIKSWAEGNDKPKIQGFFGYKAGMTHAFIVDYRPTSTTSGREVKMAVTVVETPPMKVAAVRAYQRTAYGLQCVGEIWAERLDSELARRVPLRKHQR